MRTFLYFQSVQYTCTSAVQDVNKEMGNTHLEPETKDKLKAYMKETDCRTASRGVDSLLAEHRELEATKRENELLHRLLKPYLDEMDG